MFRATSSRCEAMISQATRGLWQRESLNTVESLRNLYRIDEIPVDERLEAHNKRSYKQFERFCVERSRHLHDTTVSSFLKAKDFVRKFYADGGSCATPVILDSGCGHGASTAALGALYPTVPVIGIDRSIARLKENGLFSASSATSGNVLLLQADFVGFWLLASWNADWTVAKHIFWHPNPHPRPMYLHQRIHASPIFPIIPLLGGEICLRTNWKTYAQEFQAALSSLGELNSDYRAVKGPVLQNADTKFLISHFDKKYAKIDIQMYDLNVSLRQRTLADRRKMYPAIAADMDKLLLAD